MIPKSLVKRVPYIGTAISGLGLALDVKEIIETTTPVGAAKIIVGRFAAECTPPELLIAGKCVMLTSGIVATVVTGGNPLVLGGTLSAARSIVRG